MWGQNEKDTGMLLTPTLDCFRLVTAHIIQYHMNVFVLVLLNDTIQKAKKVLRSDVDLDMSLVCGHQLYQAQQITVSCHLAYSHGYVNQFLTKGWISRPGKRTQADADGHPSIYSSPFPARHQSPLRVSAHSNAFRLQDF